MVMAETVQHKVVLSNSLRQSLKAKSPQNGIGKNLTVFSAPSQNKMNTTPHSRLYSAQTISSNSHDDCLL